MGIGERPWVSQACWGGGGGDREEIMGLTG